MSKEYKIISYIPGIEDTPVTNKNISIDLSKYISMNQLYIDGKVVDRIVNLDNVYLMNKHFTIDNDPILPDLDYNLASFQNINLLNQLIGLLNNTIHITSANLIDLIEQTSSLIINQIDVDIDNITLSDPIFTANSGMFALKDEAFSGDYNDLINKPLLFSGNYNDLNNKPTIPSKTSQLENDSGFISDIDIDLIRQFSFLPEDGYRDDLSCNVIEQAPCDGLLEFGIINGNNHPVHFYLVADKYSEFNSGYHISFGSDAPGMNSIEGYNNPSPPLHPISENLFGISTMYILFIPSGWYYYAGVRFYYNDDSFEKIKVSRGRFIPYKK